MQVTLFNRNLALKDPSINDSLFENFITENKPDTGTSVPYHVILNNKKKSLKQKLWNILIER